MMTPEQILTETLKQQPREESSAEIRTVLDNRLTGGLYLTCDDFDHFDTRCCDTCHTSYPHCEMWIVVLSDGRHAWVL